MKLTFRHVQGYSSVDHFGPEIVYLCDQIAATRPQPDNLRFHDDHVLSDYRKMFTHGRSIVREAIARFRPGANYSGPSWSSIRIQVCVASGNDGAPPLVSEDNASFLKDYIDAYKKIPLKNKTEWRKEWVQEHPQCHF